MAMNILEVGVGSNRFAEIHAFEPSILGEQDLYVTLDSPIEDQFRDIEMFSFGRSVNKVDRISAGDKMWASADEFGFDYQPIFGDGRSAPFADDAFDVGIALNVLSDPSLGYDNRSMILEQLVRVSRVVMLAESYTPQFLTIDDGAVAGLEVVDVEDSSITGVNNYRLSLGLVAVVLIGEQDDIDDYLGTVKIMIENASPGR